MPVELSKTTTDPQAPAAADPGKPAEGKKTTEPPKVATDPKAPAAAAAPGKPTDVKNPGELTKTSTDPTAPAAADPGKPGED